MSVPGADHAHDVIVIGMRPVGVSAAEGARAAGLSVAAVERELVGGECSYWACIPSKAMLRPVSAAAAWEWRWPAPGRAWAPPSPCWPCLKDCCHAVAGQLPLTRLWHAVPCFPSVSEVWLRLLQAYRG
jgi:glycine/D-amino acid oxidase-like deaminating enzyme